MTLEYACAAGDPETIRGVWDRMTPPDRSKSPDSAFTAAAFHHLDVTRWLTEESPEWLGRVRRFARERRLFDVLARLPEATESQPVFHSRMPGLLAAHLEAVEQLEIPLARASFAFDPICYFDSEIPTVRTAPSLFLGKAVRRCVIGVFLAIPWPDGNSTATDAWCGSFLFTIEGAETKRFPSVRPPLIKHADGKLSVGELTLDLTKGKFSVDATRRGTAAAAAQFPAISGWLGEWEVWAL